ncbi:MAG TPA: cytochrome c biogenesis protein DipZ [Pseudonocardiaceae bacterium]|nr:cytochrome c biogenesis protein DipZ [Pseudonocardiaceae bacterium]
MITLIVVGFLAGVITSISPCVLPVLPVVLTAGTSRKTDEDATETRRSWRPYGVVLGLVLSFSVATLFGSLLLSALHLPQDLLRDAGIAVLVLIGTSLIWTRFGELLERPFTRIRGRQVNPDGNGLVLGLGLGLLFVPCAGPVLATIAVVGATHRIGFGAIVLTAAFGVGVGVPLLVLAVAGDAIARRTGVLRGKARQLRIVGGSLMIVIAVLIGFNVTDGLQRSVPGYTTALQNSVEQNPNAANHLHQLTTGGTNGPGAAAASDGGTCTEGGPALENCGPAPAIAGITGWLNTPGNQPLTLAALRGKVVLIDFWTYSCINCQRALPHVEAWYRAYQNDGLVVIGVHTPEFAFEHVTSNISAQAATLGVRYPIAIDNDYGTWNAYSNQYWPAEYLIDPSGMIRHVAFGEGGYATTEELIRQLLSGTKTGQNLPRATEISDATPTEQQTAETYLGYQYAPLHVSGTAPAQDAAQAHQFPATLQPDTFALAGTWTDGSEAITAGADARLELSYQARVAYLVLGGSGTVTVQINGKTTTTLTISGVPKLYTLATGAGARALLTLSVTSGVQAYDFTFG